MATSTQDLVAHFVTKLTTSLPALVSAESLTAISRYLNHEPAMAQPDKSPTVWVDVNRMERSWDAGRGASFHKYSQHARIYVGVDSVNQDPGTVATTIRGYVDLIRKLIEGENVRGATGNVIVGVDGCYWALCDNVDFSPPVAIGTSIFREAVLEFDVNRVVTTGEE